MRHLETKTKIILIGAGGLLLVYLGVSSPKGLVIDDNGNPVGILNNFRALVQGSGFWTDQQKALDIELTREINRPQEMANLTKQMKSMVEGVHQQMESMFQQYPERRPPLAQRQAQALRDQADAIERAETMAMLERIRVERIQKLKQLQMLILFKDME